MTLDLRLPAETMEADPIDAGLPTIDGIRLFVRPVRADDGPLLSDFYAHMTLEDLRLRFLTAASPVGPEQIERVTRVDHQSMENLLAFEAGAGTLVGSAVLAQLPDPSRAEVAVAVRSDWRHRGIGWAMLHLLVDLAQQRGIRTLETLESIDHHDAIAVERAHDFHVVPAAGGPGLVLLRANLD